MIELGNPLFIVYGCTRDLLLIKLEQVSCMQQANDNTELIIM